MRITIFLSLLFIFLFFVSYPSAAQTPDSWITYVNSITTGRYGAVCFEMNGKIYLGTGMSASGTVLRDFWEYNPSTGIWAQKANLPIGRYDAIGFAVNYMGEPYPGGGYTQLPDIACIGGGRTASGEILSNYYQYDYSTNIWNVTPCALGARYGAIVIPYTENIYDNFGMPYSSHKVFVGMGRNSSGTLLNDFYEIKGSYPVGNISVSIKQSFPGSAREYAAGFSLLNNCYVGTGKNLTGTELNDFWRYSIQNDEWSQTGDFIGTPRSGSVGFRIGKLGYIFGGSGMTDLYSFNDVTNVWNIRQSLGGAVRFFPKGASADGKGFIMTGFDKTSTYYTDLNKYTPSEFLTIPVYGTVPVLCAGQPFRIPFEAGGLNFTSENVFYAELSNGQGEFLSPVIIGSLKTSLSNGYIDCIIPSDLTDGINYKIRIRSGSPLFTGDYMVLSINSYQIPAVSISSDHGISTCQGDNIIITATGAFGGTNPVYTWLKNGTPVGSNSPTYSDNLISNGDIIQCQLTSDRPCASAGTVTSNSLTFSVYTNPDKPSILNNGNLLTCSNTDGNYQWYLEDNEITGANAKDLEIDKSGNYKVKVTNNNGCLSVSDAFSAIFTGINNSYSNMKLAVYPNPFKTSIIIKHPGEPTCHYSIILRDLTGKVIVKDNDIAASEYTIYGNGIKEGIYILELKDEKSYFIKIIKQ